MSREYTPEPGSIRELPELAAQAVDQAVIDGLVDGQGLRVEMRKLIRFALDDEIGPPGFLPAFRRSLEAEDRYVDSVSKDQHGFRPELDPDSTVMPSPIAIVAGTALCDEKTRQRTLDFMDQLARTVYRRNLGRTGILSMRELGGSLRAGGYPDLSRAQFGAFLGYMHQDPRFYPIGDGRIVLTDIHPNADTLIEAQSLDNVTMAVNEALPFIRTNTNGVFTEGMFLGTMRALRGHIRSDQMEDVFEALRSSPYVHLLRDGRYKLVESAQGRLAPENQLSLEGIMRATESNSRPRYR